MTQLPKWPPIETYLVDGTKSNYAYLSSNFACPCLGQSPNCGLYL